MSPEEIKFSKIYLMPIGIIFSIPPITMITIIVIKSIQNGVFIGGWFIVFPFIWGVITVPLIGSKRVWSINTKEMKMCIYHMLFNYTAKKREIDLREYKGVAWGRVKTQNSPRIFYSFFTLIHSSDVYKNIYGIGGFIRNENEAREKAADLASLIDFEFLGRYDSESLSHQVYGR